MPKVFDADQRAQDREQAGLRLDGKTYTRRRRTNRVMREVRRLSRRQSDLQDDTEKLTRASEVDALEAELDDKKSPPSAERAAAIRLELGAIRDARDEDAIAEVEDQFEDTLFELLALLLGPSEDGTEITAQELADKLDFADAVDLSRALMDVAEVDPDREAAEADPDPT